MTQELFEKLNKTKTPEEMIKVCDEILEEYPFMLDIKFLKADALLDLGKIDETLEVYDDCIQSGSEHGFLDITDEGFNFSVNDGSIDAYNGKAKVYCRVNDYESALKELENALELDENNTLTLINIALINMMSNKNNLAIEYFKKVLKINPNHELAKTHLNNLENNPFTEAEKDLQKAMLFQQMGEYSQALEIYQKINREYPTCIPAWNNQGLIYSEMSEEKKAIDCYIKAIELNPNNFKALQNIAYSYLSIGEFENANKYFDKYLKINPDDEYILTNNAMVLIQLKQYEKAIEMSDKALDINPELVEIYNNKAWCYEALNDFKKAVETYDKGLCINPNHDMLYNNKAWCLKQMKKYDESLECYKKAIELNPNEKSYWRSKGEVLEEMNRIKEAEECYKKALKLN